jgi:hypothetical protein
MLKIQKSPFPIKSENFDFPEKNKELLISENDVWILSYYASSELMGGLLMGKMARRTQDATIRSRLIWHCAEETRHSLRWVETLRKLGADPVAIKDTYQSNYLSRIGVPENETDLLIITQVFELRVARHFTAHKKRKDTHPLVEDMLTTMILDEGEHIRWVREKLDLMILNGAKQEIAEKFRKYEEIDVSVYKQEASKFVALGWEIPTNIKVEGLEL